MAPVQSVHVSKWPPFIFQTGARPRVKMALKNGGRVPVPGVGSRCEVVGPVRQVRPFDGEHVVVASCMKENRFCSFSRVEILK
jgi:hypothetical protein